VRADRDDDLADLRACADPAEDLGEEQRLFRSAEARRGAGREDDRGYRQPFRERQRLLTSCV
jgi:hypothetical protein